MTSAARDICDRDEPGADFAGHREDGGRRRTPDRTSVRDRAEQTNSLEFVAICGKSARARGESSENADRSNGLALSTCSSNEAAMALSAMVIG
jgi:hypothetical protein